MCSEAARISRSDMRNATRVMMPSLSIRRFALKSTNCRSVYGAFCPVTRGKRGGIPCPEGPWQLMHAGTPVSAFPPRYRRLPARANSLFAAAPGRSVWLAKYAARSLMSCSLSGPAIPFMIGLLRAPVLNALSCAKRYSSRADHGLRLSRRRIPIYVRVSGCSQHRADDGDAQRSGNP